MFVVFVQLLSDTRSRHRILLDSSSNTEIYWPFFWHRFGSITPYTHTHGHKSALQTERTFVAHISGSLTPIRWHGAIRSLLCDPLKGHRRVFRFGCFFVKIIDGFGFFSRNFPRIVPSHHRPLRFTFSHCHLPAFWHLCVAEWMSVCRRARLASSEQFAKKK